MRTPVFTGSCPALATPFDQNGNINYDAFGKLIDALFIEVNPIPIKAAMNLMGMEAGSLRLPLCDISHKNLETLRQAMGRMGLL